MPPLIACAHSALAVIRQWVTCTSFRGSCSPQTAGCFRRIIGTDPRVAGRCCRCLEVGMEKMGGSASSELLQLLPHTAGSVTVSHCPFKCVADPRAPPTPDPNGSRCSERRFFRLAVSAGKTPFSVLLRLLRLCGFLIWFRRNFVRLNKGRRGDRKCVTPGGSRGLCCGQSLWL